MRDCLLTPMRVDAMLMHDPYTEKTEIPPIISIGFLEQETIPP